MKLRPFQIQALEALGKDSPTHLILTAPTGAGKSLIFQEYSRVSHLKTLLLSPLVALGRQHAARLRAQGLSASILGEGHEKESRIWISSPEKLFLSHWVERENFGFFVMDECHTLREWGEKFRPALLAIPDWFQRKKITKSLWMTATLPPEDREWLRGFLPAEDLVELGQMRLPKKLSLRFERVSFGRRPMRILKWIESHGSAGIIFTQTRTGAEKTKNLLLSAGIPALSYHAGLSHEERLTIENAVASPVPPLIVATTAFGMGMDFTGMDWVLLLQPPFSILQLAQQIGRCARKNETGHALILWDSTDFRESWCDQTAFQKVESLIQAPGCRARALENLFQTSESLACGLCDRCCTLSSWNDPSESHFSLH